jgi:hypothetical protein
LRPAFRQTDSEQVDSESDYQAIRSLARQRAGEPTARVKVVPARAGEVQRAVAVAARGRRQLSSFEPFSRDTTQEYFCCTARGGFSMLVGAEIQPCFDNAYLQPLTAPRSDKEARCTVSALRQICDQLKARGIVGCFAMTAQDQQELGAAYLANGFRRTGKMKKHLLVAGRRHDAFLWSQRLAQPGDD